MLATITQSSTYGKCHHKCFIDFLRPLALLQTLRQWEWYQVFVEEKTDRKVQHAWSHSAPVQPAVLDFKITSIIKDICS